MIRLRVARPGDAQALWKVSLATTESTFRGLVPDDVYQRMCTSVRAANPWPHRLTKRDQFTIVAETAAGHLVGYATVGHPRPDPPGWDGELYLLYVLQEYQRQGIGRRLVAGEAEQLAAQGCRSLVVWSLATNWPSRWFYEALGATLVEERRITDPTTEDALPIAIYGLAPARTRAPATVRHGAGRRAILHPFITPAA